MTGIEMLNTEISETKNYKRKLRIKLDLLGEYYTMWLDSIVLANEIEPGNNIEFHELSDLSYS